MYQNVNLMVVESVAVLGVLRKFIQYLTYTEIVKTIKSEKFEIVAPI